MDIFQMYINGVTDMLTNNLGFFAQIGMNLFKGFALIMVVMFGLQSAFGSEGFNFGQLFKLMTTLIIGYTFVFYYSNPVPGLDYSFPELFSAMSRYLSAQLSQQQMDLVVQQISSFQNKIPAPGITAILHGYLYFTIIILCSAVEAILMAVISFGIIAQGVLLLLGPIFIPWFIVPQMEWMFWGWFRAYIQYCFYQVVASAYVYIVAKFLTAAFVQLDQSMTTLNWNLLSLIAPILMMFVTVIWGATKVPSLVSSIFAGRSGESGFPLPNFLK